jgi:purine-binding chemotaxis protein CheW
MQREIQKSDEKAHHTQHLYLITKLKERLFALPAESIREIVLMPPHSPLPHAAPHVRGVINLRGRVIQLVDLRIRLGMTSLQDELKETTDMLTAREQDHKNWLTELEASIRQKRPFTLARDPHTCEFGKWYDHFKTENHTLASVLFKFSVPHGKIHAVADVACGYADTGDFDRAFAVIEAAHNRELKRMIDLFEEARSTFCHSARELVVVVNLQGENFALSVDSVESLEKIEYDTIEDIPPIVQGITMQTARRSKTQEIVLILDIEDIFLTKKRTRQLEETQPISREHIAREQLTKKPDTVVSREPSPLEMEPNHEMLSQGRGGVEKEKQFENA